MTLNATYDPENIFAKIVRGEIPAVKLCEDDATLAFMDVFPQTEGHCLVVHKHATATNLLNVGAEELNAIMATVQRVARAVKEGLKPDGLRIAQFNGADAGQTIYHLHFHIIPITAGGAARPHASGGPAPAEELEKIAEKIRAAL